MSHSQTAYTLQSDASQSLSLQQKLDALNEILGVAKYGMLTTRDADGNLHSRAMGLSSFEGAHFFFLTDQASSKCHEIDVDENCNVSFLDPSSTNWISVSGMARKKNDRELIKKLWSPMSKAWFGNLGDGIHKGDHTDPRVLALEVVPNEIRLWKATRSQIGQKIDIAVSVVTGNVSSPGDLVTITRDEVKKVEALHQI